MLDALSSTRAAVIVILGITVVTLGLIAYCIVAGIAIPAVVMTLLGVVLGFLGHSAGSAQGASQALATPAVVAPTTSTPVPTPTALSTLPVLSSHDTPPTTPPAS